MRSTLTTLFIVASLSLAISVWAASERVFHIEFVTPRATQRGTTVEVKIEGAFIKNASEVLFYRPGIKCTSIKPLPSLPTARRRGMGGVYQDEIMCRFEVAPDCPVGLHPFRLRTPTELTTLSTFAVTALPIMNEGENKLDSNGTRQTATPVTLGTAVLGSLYERGGQVADVDFYRVSGKAGSRLSIEIDSVRLSEVNYCGTEFDLKMRVLDDKGHELTRNDDNALHMQDPIISMLLPRDGDYFIEIKQGIYAFQSTEKHCYYLAHFGAHSRPMAVYPAGGQAGKSLQVTLLGDPTGDISKAITLPATEGAFDFYDDMPAPLPMRVSRYDNVLEDSAAEETQVKVLPAALNGIIDHPGDTDQFRIHAKKDERWRVRVFARALGTPLDPHIVIRRAGSDAIEIESDDATMVERGFYARSIQDKAMMDPSIVWEPKENGDYLLTIDDERGLGDPLSVYRIEIEPLRDEVSTFIVAPLHDGVEGPRLNSIAIPQGNRWTVNFNLGEGQGNRYKGELELIAKDLPKGVSMIAPRITTGTKQVQAQFIAEAGTSPQVALITLLVKATDGSPLVSHAQQGFAFLNQSGGKALHSIAVDCYALAVTEAAPFTIDIVQPKIPLSQNCELSLAVKITRRAGFNEPVEFQCDWVPPGVQGDSTITIPAGQSDSVMHLHADPTAEPGNYKLAVTATTTGGWDYSGVGRTRVSTGFIDLIVDEPYVVLKGIPSAVRCGSTTQVEWNVEHKKPFEGEAEAILLGLPKGVSVLGIPKLKAGQAKLIFTITATNEVLLGQYKELACELVINERGQKIRQRSDGKGILRVDPKLSSKKTPQTVK